MSDPIDRQAAIDALIEWYGCEPSDIDDFKKILAKQPSAHPEPRWIPVTERLPEVDENVLVSYHLHGESEFFPSHNGVTISYWTGVKNHNIPYFGDLGDASTVLAWMPLPEPYRKETEDGKIHRCG